MRQPTRFAIIGQARSGTNLIAYSLDRCRGVKIFGEVFNPHASVRAYNEARGLRSHASAETDGAGYLSREVYGPRWGASSVGFKLLTHQALNGPNESAWKSIAEDRGICVIFMSRANLLESLISAKSASISQEWLVTANGGQSPTQLEPFELSAEECEDYFWDALASVRRFRSIFKFHRQFVELEYARDILHGYSAAIARVCSALRVDAPADPSPPLVKQSLRTPRAQLKNFDQLQSRFRGSAYEVFFEDTSRTHQ